MIKMVPEGCAGVVENDDLVKKMFDFVEVYRSVDMDSLEPKLGFRFTRALSDKERNVLIFAFQQLNSYGDVTIPLVAFMGDHKEYVTNSLISNVTELTELAKSSQDTKIIQETLDFLAEIREEILLSALES
jgi:hypothetical protein